MQTNIRITSLDGLTVAIVCAHLHVIGFQHDTRIEPVSNVISVGNLYNDEGTAPSLRSSISYNVTDPGWARWNMTGPQFREFIRRVRRDRQQRSVSESEGAVTYRWTTNPTFVPGLPRGLWERDYTPHTRT